MSNYDDVPWYRKTIYAAISLAVGFFTMLGCIDVLPYWLGGYVAMFSYVAVEMFFAKCEEG